MLAAATAFGLVTASQADSRENPVEKNGTINFDSETVGNAATNITGFVFNGAEGDDESQVVEPGYNSSAAALQVSTGTDPLLRSLNTVAGAAEPISLSNGPLEISAQVQFTVTPCTDNVEASESDKLMIYLKEMTNDVGTVTGTNLMVKALEFKKAAYDEDQDAWVEGASNVVDVAAVYAAGGSAVEVNPGTWYNLKVAASLQDGETMFAIYLDGVQLKPADTLYTGAENLFPSLLAGSSNSQLQYVGFAGEGVVDNILVRQIETENSVTFTLTLNSNVSAVTYTINDGAASSASTAQVYVGDVIKVASVSYAEGYVAAAGSPAYAGFSSSEDGYTVSGTCSLTFSATLNSVDFTFTLGTGVTAINWTIAGGSASTALSGSGTPGAAITINSVTYADWYVAAGSVTNGAVLTAAATTFNVAAAAAGGVTPPANPGDPVVIANTTTPADLGITGEFASEQAGSETLAKVVAWATASGKGGYGSMSAAVAAISEMDFTDATETQAEKSYLLNCANTPEAVAAAVAGFKFESFDPANPPADTYFDAKGYNGDVTIQGATTLGNWHTATEGDKFFRATLTK